MSKADNLKQQIKKTKANLDTVRKANQEKGVKRMVGTVGNPKGSSSGAIHGLRQSSVENRTLSAFGVSHVKDLLSINTSLKRYAGVPLDLRMGVASIKEAFDIARFTAQYCLEGKGDDPASEAYTPVKSIFETNYAKEVLLPLLKAFGTDIAGAGAEWIPTAISTSYIPEYELDRRLATLLKEMPMPTNPFKMPVMNNVTVARRATQNVAMTERNFGTSEITFEAEKFAEFYIIPEELDQDSAPPIFAMARGQVIEAQSRAKEAVAINSDDSGGGHMDADVVDVDDARTYSKGFRKLALDNSLNGSVINFNGPVTLANCDKMRRALGNKGVNVRELLYSFSPSTYFQAVELEEVTSAEKFGGQATILDGTLDALRGVPVTISEQNREDLNAAGVHSGVPADDVKGSALIINMTRFWYGMRQPVRLKVQPDLAYQDRMLLASYSRFDFKGHAQTDEEVSVALGVNIDIAN